MGSRDLPKGLQYRPDPAKPTTHGFIEPSEAMTLRQYEDLLAKTKDTCKPVPVP
jgi:hypothetical protein